VRAQLAEGDWTWSSAARARAGIDGLLEARSGDHRRAAPLRGIAARGVARRINRYALALCDTDPATLSLTLYGDLDVSFLDEMPPAKAPSRPISQLERTKLHERMAAALRTGTQCYIVYPLSKSRRNGSRGRNVRWPRSAGARFPRLPVGLLHGRMKSDEKRRGHAQVQPAICTVLVATTVIEVGIDVPNPGIMVIEHAERFGLAQLHQRAGASAEGRHAFCCLVADEAPEPESMERLRYGEARTDGFGRGRAD